MDAKIRATRKVDRKAAMQNDAKAREIAERLKTEIKRGNAVVIRYVNEVMK